jgi:DNA polymerase IV
VVDEPAARTILHVDMDAFYASVEVNDDPTLSGKPVIVGGTGPRGVVASCTYEARAYGVRSAMPGSQARRLCPQAVFLAGRFDRYAEVSSQIHAIFEDYTPLVEGISLDEAFLDVTGSLRLFGPASRIGADIRARVRNQLGLGCSVGVAPVKFLAKLASEAAKPRASLQGVLPGPGVVVIEPGQELDFLHPLPIEALWGVGPATAARLRRLGVTTVAELARVPADALERVLGRANGSQLARLAQGSDDRRVEPDRETKSVSHEETYAVDRYEADDLHVEVVRMADSVASRMRRAGLVGRTVTVKVRYGDFSTHTRSRTSPARLGEGTAIAGIALQLLGEVDVSPGVRLLGVGVSNLATAGSGPAEQMTLDLDSPGGRGSGREVSPRAGREDAAAAVDAIRDRYGSAAVGPAVLLGSGGVRVKRPGDTQWGPSSDPPI